MNEEFDIVVGDECVFIGDFDGEDPFVVTRIIGSNNPFSQTWYFIDGIFYSGETVSRVNNYSVRKTGRNYIDIIDLLQKIKRADNE